MKRSDAKELAHTITNEQLRDMFVNAKNNITNWNVVSTGNKGFSKGVAWNLLAKAFDVNAKYKYISKLNMIYEFGDHLDESLKPKKVIKVKSTFTHYEPIFDNYEEKLKKDE